MTKIIGLTGGIGSGKTKIANYMEKKGIPVYIADIEAKKILDNSDVIKKVKEAFDKVVVIDEKIDRKSLANEVFNNPEKLQKLNNIIHPEVRKHFAEWVKNHKQHPFVVKEAAILFESGSYKECDKIITVTAPIEERIKRVINRDKSSYNDVLQRVNNQWTDEQRAELSDYVVENIDFKQTKKHIDLIIKELSL